MTRPSDKEVKHLVEKAFEGIFERHVKPILSAPFDDQFHKVGDRLFVKNGYLYKDVGHDFFPIELDQEGEMTEDKIREALDKCAKIAMDAGALVPERLCEEDRGVRFNAAASFSENRERCLNHVYYLALDGHTLLGEARTEKAHRHLGWVQGALWGLGLVSIEELMNMNRPSEPNGGVDK